MDIHSIRLYDEKKAALEEELKLMDSLYQRLYNRAAEHGQEHLLRFYPELTEPSRSKLLEQMEQLDFAVLEELFRSARQESTDAIMNISPISYEDASAYSGAQKAQLLDLGLDLLRQGKAAALVVAGGQGSRLGHPGPKGTFRIGLPSGKSLFQLQAERLLNLSRRAGRSIPWYIMTSPDNHTETVQHFENHGYFRYKQGDVFFFQQQVLPALDMNGRVLLSAMDEIGLAPSGNGDAFASLKKSGALHDMKTRGVEWLFYYNVDNAAIKVADPLFLGAAAHHNRPIATKVVEKAYPEEKVGILCLRDGLPAVIEYTDVPAELMNQSDAQGRLVFGLGNISIHLFRTDFIERHADTDIPYHAAFKAIKYVSDSGELMAPSVPNAYKFERFIFDFFPLAGSMTVLKSSREEEFAPVKNKEGADSPASARRLLLDMHRSWLLQSGVPSAQLEGHEIEISPLDSYGGEGLTVEVLRKLGLGLGQSGGSQL